MEHFIIVNKIPRGNKSFTFLYYFYFFPACLTEPHLKGQGRWNYGTNSKNEHVDYSFENFIPYTPPFWSSPS